MSKGDKLNHTFKPGKALLIPVLLCIAVVSVFSGFFTFRHMTARFALDFYYPYLNAVHTIENRTAADSLLLAPKEKLVNMVSILMKQNTILNGNAEQVRNLTEENNQLRALLKLPNFPSFLGVSAEIITRDPATWNEQFVINRGSDFGIAPGDAVLSTLSVTGKAPLAVLVGRVADVSAKMAVVTTVRSPRCQISVTVPASSATGTSVGGTGSAGYTKISRLPVDSLYQRNNRVETSGYSEHLPAGILIGYLVPLNDGRIARPEHGGLYAEAQFLPAIQYDKLRFVTVLTNPKKEEKKK